MQFSLSTIKVYFNLLLMSILLPVNISVEWSTSALHPSEYSLSYYIKVVSSWDDGGNKVTRENHQQFTPRGTAICKVVL